MKYAITILIILFALALFSLKQALGSEGLSGILTVDFAKEEAVYTESHEFTEGIPTTVTVTASVLPNECNSSECGACLCTRNPSECLDVCKDILLTY